MVRKRHSGGGDGRERKEIPKKEENSGHLGGCTQEKRKDIMEEWEMEGEGGRKRGKVEEAGLGKGEGGKISIRFSIGADQ